MKDWENEKLLNYLTMIISEIMSEDYAEDLEVLQAERMKAETEILRRLQE